MVGYFYLRLYFRMIVVCIVFNIIVNCGCMYVKRLRAISIDRALHKQVLLLLLLFFFYYYYYYFIIIFIILLFFIIIYYYYYYYYYCYSSSSNSRSNSSNRSGINNIIAATK